MDAAAALGRNPVSKHHIQPEYKMSIDVIVKNSGGSMSVVVQLV